MKTQYINYKVSTASALQGFKQDSDIFRIWFYKDHFFSKQDGRYKTEILVGNRDQW